MLKVLIAPNSFKECADSVEIARLMEENILTQSRADYKIEVLPIICPISDGGDGFLHSLESVLHLKQRIYKISSPWDNGIIVCETGYHAETNTLYVESANLLGLKLIPSIERHPLNLSSKGLGELFEQLMIEIQSGSINLDKVVIGIGGTGTCDFGLGMCSVLGLEIFDEKGVELKPVPENFGKISSVDWEIPMLPFQIEVILDVSSPLLGKDGASRAFAPQKGATEKEVEILENGIAHFLTILNRKYPVKGDLILYGAGGGLAASLHYFFHAQYKFSQEFVNELLDKKCSNEEFDFVITGEGAFDNLTFFNKGAMIIIEKFKEKNIPIFVCAGLIKSGTGLDNLKTLYLIEISKYFSEKDESIRHIQKGIKLAIQDVLKIYFSGKVSS